MSYDIAKIMWDEWTPQQRKDWVAMQAVEETALGYAAVAEGNPPEAASRFAAAAILMGMLAKKPEDPPKDPK